MKKLLIVFTTLGLMFQIAGCNGKKAQEDTQVVENADVEKVEAEDASFAGNEATVSDTGPVDESLQAALGETPQVDAVAAEPTTTEAPTEVVDTTAPTAESIDIAAAPTIDESTISETPVTPSNSDVAANTAVDAGISETPVLETPAPTQDIAQTDSSIAAELGQTDTSLTPDTSAAATTETAAVTETPVVETPTSTPSDTSSSVASESAVTAQAFEASTPKATTAANSKGLRKIAETTPYPHGEGYVNTVYIARPKEKLKDISQAIYGMDKTKELKSINSFLKGRGPKAGEKIYYVSPNRPTDSARTLSYYEDTGMIASTYVAQKGDNLTKISKKLLGYDNAWKEVWTTNSVESKGKLAEGESLRYWRPAEQAPVQLANNEGNAKLADQLPTQNVAANVPPAQELAPPVQQAQELPPPPPPPTETVAANNPPAQELAPPVQQAQELPPPPPPADSSLANQAPPPPPADMAAAPVPPKQNAPNMEEEVIAEEGAMNSETTMMIGVVAVLVAILGFVLVRRNKKKREADMSSIEQTHVGS